MAAEVLLDLGFRIEADLHENGKGEITARREGEKITLRFRGVDPGGTQVTLALEDWSVDSGERILDRITARIAREDSPLPALALSTLKGRYSESTADCVDAAEEALRRLRLALTLREVFPTGAVISSRAPQEFIEIRIAGADRETTQVVFTAGAVGQDGADHRARIVREEFEGALIRVR